MTRTRTITKFRPRTRFQAIMAQGHLNRLQHQLTGFYITENGLSTLVRTCACGGYLGPAHVEVHHD